MSQLSIQGLSKRFGDDREAYQALDDVSLEVRSGEIVMIVGPSGCGKTTLLNIIAGLEKPDAGQVFVDDDLVTGPGPDRSVVFQDGALFPWLSARKNVEFGLREAGVAPKIRIERARQALDTVGLWKFENHAIHELSGGMRQRVAIARSLVLQPRIILMDEPFSALDALTREDLYGELQEILSERGATIVFVTHNVREAVTLGDRVVLMSARPGRIHEVFDVEILRPRHIDDVDVASAAQRISRAMKQGPLNSHEPPQENPVLRAACRPVGDLG